MSATLGRWLALSLGLGAITFVSPLWAQDPFGPGVMPGGMSGPPSGPPPSSAAPPKPPPGTPELHAASTGDDSLLPPGAEPSLPQEPLKLNKFVREHIGSDLDPGTLELGRGEETKHKFYGPYYEEYSGRYRFRLAFPVWAERVQPSLSNPDVTDRASLFGGLYYNRRSAEHADDVLFPLFWNLSNPLEGSRTTVLGPFVNRVTPEGHDNWLAPLYFTGKRQRGGYTIIPPLLTYTNSDAKGGFNLVGPLFCSWEGGPSCDTRTAQNIDFGVAPLYFFGQNAQTKYEAIPPLLHYYRYDDRDLSWLNVWGPYYRRHTQERDMFHLLPLYFSIWGADERHTTVLPFFHYGWKGNSSLFVNPLYLSSKGEKGESTFVTYLYARYRGRTELDMITPLYWRYRDPDIDLDQHLLFPFLYSRTSPRESSQVFFPFWGHFERFGVSETTWITPFFQHSTDLRGWSTNLHPILYIGRDALSTHTVIAPFYWDFASPTSRATVAFPFFYRFSDTTSVSQLVGNVFYHDRKLSNGLDWEFHFFPAFSYGETPDGHWWNILYGLAGYTRKGRMTEMRTLWIPITLSGAGN